MHVCMYAVLLNTRMHVCHGISCHTYTDDGGVEVKPWCQHGKEQQHGRYAYVQVHVHVYVYQNSSDATPVS